MLSSGLISLLFALGVSGWTYSKMERRVGVGNNRSLYTMVAVAFGVSFIVFITLFKFVLNFK